MPKLIRLGLELGPSLGSSSRLEPKFRLAVNKGKARARSSLKSQSSVELFYELGEARTEQYGRKFFKDNFELFFIPLTILSVFLKQQKKATLFAIFIKGGTIT